MHARPGPSFVRGSGRILSTRPPRKERPRKRGGAAVGTSRHPSDYRFHRVFRPSRLCRRRWPSTRCMDQACFQRAPVAPAQGLFLGESGILTPDYQPTYASRPPATPVPPSAGAERRRTERVRARGRPRHPSRPRAPCRPSLGSSEFEHRVSAR
ncbi:hypothetical protein F8B43_3040 [Methylorubrum populi]|uniref:Uncharacterized protein n=1 Tax=Methylorubrum populi TaxID=223967 RepID=A0A833MX72_9HYPH|nr:hypothetical protein F8B43_3040 [Methylorubrum populi]